MMIHVILAVDSLLSLSYALSYCDDCRLTTFPFSHSTYAVYDDNGGKFTGRFYQVKRDSLSSVQLNQVLLRLRTVNFQGEKKGLEHPN